ncbi:ORF6N domain-containing protein [Clostridium tagluense]|uniref:ORF6N domain-containing protein n=1 Tax=Clostridium tagluense TaxID=360422 RepID=UPI001CF23D53|nr:ORF6N domain-containing protein [Clostridium tagluense]MCB2300235.1 ORF6N domain-containing protein [Clostridium tagluense]
MNLLKVEHKNQRVLTTEQLALGYGASERNINDNFNNHKDRFIEGKHYFLLQGDKLRCFKNYPDNIGVACKRAPSMHLWTERGALRHAKILDTDKAWEVYEMLEETYYREVIEINPGAEWRKKSNLIISKICKGLNNYRTPKDDIYNALEERAKCKLKTRLNNLKVRALSQGMHQCKVNQLNNLDVIDNDPKLKEIYIAIVKEKAIKHGIRLNDY